jgi:EAL domain-containing protein (putative c-di-GMP-specific phosphodiesterase class I)
MQSAPSSTPWLEYSAEQGLPVQKCLLTSFPFSIGRNVTTDLPINSTKVSREHAAIVRVGKSYRIRDLDSTNGTLVNGQRIEEATLSDGDIVTIADVELTFFTGLPQAPRKTVTQVIGFRESEGAALRTQDLLRSVRRLQETLLQGAQCAARQEVTELATGKMIGFVAVARPVHLGTSAVEADRTVLAAQPRLAVRLRETFFLLAAEWLSQDHKLKLFLPLEAADLDPTLTEQYVDLLASAVPDLGSVVLEFPDSAINDLAYLQELYRRLKSRGVRLCYADFAAGKAQLEVHNKMPPDYLKLSRTLVRGALQDTSRQSQLQAILSDCRRIGCEVIVPELESRNDARLLARLGCRYEVGDATTSASIAPKQSPIQQAAPPAPAVQDLAFGFIQPAGTR